ncbi:hypothetical protein [Nocardioides marmotae]|uniref:Uncharacterized protein n=1 Tax=Nocardioides marmotae TaxID=2663857 RepID=A0A6I3IYE6_9ACTN|nr:hypothetical protein [Nocardioides marmotae]MCR6030060.1 hypothetical protein [Gordonia jinghuaiqii]MBC9733017.1 hypothetical protein [Nocardioides marmotae]MTB84131.1 hypothetical protein [Nocardioides marmotae]MTB93691.1 hypothetical protein [Nocardioides marmotae]QKE00038.1 hypothetical protein HPC71_02275 [Nocardioides marmotae]
MDAVTHRRHIIEVAERLVIEFAGTLPPGQVLRTVHRANRLVVHSVTDEQRAVDLCESIARRLIRDRCAEVGHPSAPA